jgi:hypothetical protein
MSNPSPNTKKIGASSDISRTTPNSSNNINKNAPPPPRQIRFVSSDGQPQTKRRRVTAAYVYVLGDVGLGFVLTTYFWF